MPEKWAGFGWRACHQTVRFAALPRSYVAAFISGRLGSALWMAVPAVRRVARYVLSKKWPDVAGYTHAETSRGLDVKIQNSRLRFPAFHSNSREAQ